MRGRRPGLPVRQLVILSICRFAEPVVVTSVLPYLPEMVEYVGVGKNEVAKWVGISSAVSSASQGLTAIAWGTASDSVGRKPTILLGLACTMILSLVFGLSKTLTMLVVSRCFLGLTNGNVGIIRTMVAEMIPQKELQPRAFSIMPLVWTIGSIFGPAFGGALANPAEKHPEIFGSSAFLKEYPFILPNLTAACLFVIGITAGFLFLHETMEAKKDRRDYGLVLGRMLTRPCTSHKRKRRDQDEEATALLEQDAHSGRSKRKSAGVKKLSWQQILSSQSNLILAAYGMMSMHTMAFDSLIPVFLHYPEQPLRGNPSVRLPFKFVGGFGVDSQTIGIFYTLIGITGMFVQFLLFPIAAKRYGVLNCTRAIALFFPFVYLATPFTALVPGPMRNVAVFFLLFSKLTGAVFGFPCLTILLTNSAASLSVLGTINGVGTSVAAFGRAAGPAIMGAAFSLGVERGFIIIPWWSLAAFSAISAIPTFWVVETDDFHHADDDDNDDNDDDGNGETEGDEYEREEDDDNYELADDDTYRTARRDSGDFPHLDDSP